MQSDTSKRFMNVVAKQECAGGDDMAEGGGGVPRSCLGTQLQIMVGI